jgi:hypothetical protein
MYIKNEKLNFGQAIELLKAGKLVSRKNWNGKHRFLWLKQGVTIQREWCKDPLLLNVIDLYGECEAMEGLGTVRMKTADDKILTGWLASQTDMLSEDWQEIELPRNESQNSE